MTGKPLDRVDGRLKVTGGAKYAADFQVPNVVHAIIVRSTATKGRIVSIETGKAARAKAPQPRGDVRAALQGAATKVDVTLETPNHVPTHADIPELDVVFVDERDERVNPLGIKGLGEVAIVGVAAAVANAVFHATGQRVRDLPITPDKLLEGV